MSDEIVYSQKGHVAYIILNRPDYGNKINSQLTGELRKICSQIRQDQETYVVVLTGAGDSFFCGGSETIESQYSETVANEIASIDKPVIAAINGDALGQGLELALGCDIRLASTSARFGLPQIVDGYIPADGGTQRLSRIIGRSKALELILTGDIIDATAALEIGLIHKAVPRSNLMTDVAAMTQTMASKGPLALKYAKEAVIKGMDLTLEQGLRLEADLYMLLHTTDDRTEGIQAFRQKRSPNFKGK
jgi:enoyl-CoA hydratase/carnithine racemase